MVVVVVLLLMVSIYQVLMMIETRMLVNICKYPHMTTVVGTHTPGCPPGQASHQYCHHKVSPSTSSSLMDTTNVSFHEPK